jgi:hypothetical protein
MMPIMEINALLYKMEAGKNRAGSKQKRGGERKREAD